MFELGMYKATNAQSHLSLTLQEHSRQPLSMVTFIDCPTLQVGTLHVGQQTPSGVCLRYSGQLSMLGHASHVDTLKVTIALWKGKGQGKERGREGWSEQGQGRERGRGWEGEGGKGSVI